ncbi:hypothetical protein [uncultured Methanobrevibacter sp.]|uniref:hypothetical protein n=1 Tax=uncultured Methanobrevibacter sp. TaxID=253161 RepID=UPI002621CE43|nr:hypothetical protein [uncultured Methanobrevibacter sp.]
MFETILKLLDFTTLSYQYRIDEKAYDDYENCAVNLLMPHMPVFNQQYYQNYNQDDINDLN